MRRLTLKSHGQLSWKFEPFEINLVGEPTHFSHGTNGLGLYTTDILKIPKSIYTNENPFSISDF